MTTLKALGYDRSKRFIRPDGFDQLPANEFSFALRLAVKACGELQPEFGATRFEGVYVLQEQEHAPAVPVVYVITTESDAAARRIHQFVWNQNQTPFLIVESPSTVRLYQGFQFQHDEGRDNSLRSATKNIADILDKLAAFRAESIDDGSIWKQWAHAVDPKQRVDEKLLVDLRMLDRRLQEKEGMSREASHGLIGKYVYLKYLRAREILSDKKLGKWEINPDHVFTKGATLKSFRSVNEHLQDWLNGSVFALGYDSLNEIKPHQLKLVARVFNGDSPINMTEIQSSLFSLYDFSHIPIETLSCVYEQFLHDAKEKDDGPSRGKTLGAYYTPLPLADYALSEMERRHPLEPGEPKDGHVEEKLGTQILDPACGSGAFLVQCYRRLIERQRRIKQRDLKATELRYLLTSQIFGIDRDDDACRLAELSLIMTLLDYIDPPDLEHTNFKLPSLRNENIFKGDFFDLDGPAFDLLTTRKFDWIVGNPPWAEVKGKPAEDHEHSPAFQWMKAHKKTHPTSGNQIAEAFMWKAGDHLATNGACGLVVLAMTWFKKEATTFRQRFFASRRVWCLANFANLAEVLFARRSRRSASVIFFESIAPDDQHRIFTFAPFVAEQLANRPERANQRLTTWNIVVSGAELREVEQTSAINGDALTWKLAMWGTSRDRKLLERLRVRFRDSTLTNSSCFGVLFVHEGLQLRARDDSTTEPIEEHRELVGCLRLDMKALRSQRGLFAFTEESLREIGEDAAFTRIGRAKLPIAVSTPPHVIIDEARRFAVYSDDFIVVPPRQIGIAGSREYADQLRALSLFLSSDFARYHQFLNAPKWGIDEGIADLATLKTMPVPIAHLGATELAEWASLQQELARSPDSSLIASLNDRVFRLLRLGPSDRWLIEDFVNICLELSQGKFTSEVARVPTTEERLLYLTSLRECLDGFFAADRGVRHKLEVLVHGESALMAVSLVKSEIAIEPVVVAADDPASRDLKVIRDRLRTKHSQWVYFDRNLKVYDRKQGVLYQFKPMQRLQWTRRQAVLDADDIIGETLSEGGVS